MPVPNAAGSMRTNKSNSSPFGSSGFATAGCSEERTRVPRTLPAPSASSARTSPQAALTGSVNKVVPLLRERGSRRADYTGTTLRDNLGIPVPEGGAGVAVA
jgi:hypothetical protein